MEEKTYHRAWLHDFIRKEDLPDFFIEDSSNVPIFSERRSKKPHGNIGRVAWNKGKKGVYSESALKKMSERQKGRVYTEEQKQKMRNRWKDPIYQLKQEKSRRKALGKKPTCPEYRVGILLDLEGIIGMNYVGDFSFWIGGKNPDFVDKERKKIIEVFGTYWHRNTSPYSRVQYFKEYGYDTLVLWEWELKFENSVRNTIREFLA